MKRDDIIKIIRDEAEKQGIDPDLAVGVAEAESRLDPKAKNPKSTAGGLFQFLDATWKELGGDPRSKFDPVQNARLGATYMRQNRDKLMTALGREPTPGEQYGGHVFGPRGIKILLNLDPATPILEALRKVDPKRAAQIVKNNRLSGTVGDVISDFNMKVSRGVGMEPTPQARPVDQGPRPTPKLAPLEERKDVPFGTYGQVPELPPFGPGFEAAVALAGLTDVPMGAGKVKKVSTEAVAKKPSAAKQMLSSLPAYNAFPAVSALTGSKPWYEQQQPIQMADGGDVSRQEPLVEIPGLGEDGGALVLPRSQAEEFLRRLQLSASAREMDMTVPDMGLAPQVVGSQASGRIGYETEGGFGGGVSGYYVKPDNAPGMGGVGEIDASYRAGANRIGAAYNPGMDSMRYFYERNTPEGAMGVGYMPDQKAVNFFLNRRFSDGGEVLEAPPIEVTPEPTESRSMLDKLLGQRDKLLRSGLGTAADIAASVVNPLYGTAAAAADLETARREDDKLGMALSSLGMIPVAGGIIRGGGKLMQRIGKEGAESGGMSSREALEASMGDLPGRVKQAWFDLATVDLTNTKETRRLLEQAENLDVFTEAQSKKAREAIDLFEKGMIDEETLNNVMTNSVLSPLTQMWTKFEKRLGPIDVKDK